jgi:hypothetical protein
MSERYSKVVGFFAYKTKADVVCSEQACVIAGSQDAMRDYIAEISPGALEKTTIRKTRFGEILRGVELGAEYAFDEASYGRFYPLAVEEGLNAPKIDFEKNKKEGDRFLVIKIGVSGT